jgi:hypothetical protein
MSINKLIEEFKFSIIRGTDGKQQHTLEARLHTIAINVLDNDGLENIETIKLNVSGTVERQ